MTVKFKWNIPDIPLFDSKQAQALFNKEATRSLNIMVEVARTNIVFAAPVGHTGRLRQIGTSVANNVGRVFPTVNYAPVIEAGRRAGKFPPTTPLIQWIRLSKKGQRYLANLKRRYPRITVRQAAFLLGRSMKRRKRKANPFFSRGIKRSQKRLRLEAGILNRRLAVGLMT